MIVYSSSGEDNHTLFERNHKIANMVPGMMIPTTVEATMISSLLGDLQSVNF